MAWHGTTLELYEIETLKGITIMKIYQTEDGYKFYLQWDGSLNGYCVTDHPNAENSDLVFNSFSELDKAHFLKEVKETE